MAGEGTSDFGPALDRTRDDQVQFLAALKGPVPGGSARSVAPRWAARVREATRC
jgi:hypothetical protein